MNERLSRVELAPLHRVGGQVGGGATTERWSWDFVVDDQSLAAAVGGDIAGALGWGEPAVEARVVDKLLGRAAPDLPPDRVAVYICPECGDLSCGAVTVSVARDGDAVVWRDFAWERDWAAPDHGQRIALGPFRFERGMYGRLLRAGLGTRPGPGTPPLAVA